MIRIGIIGTENTHAMAFARLINLPDEKTGKLRYPDMKVVGVYGPDPDTPKAIVEKAGAEFVASSPEDFFGKVDAMMVTCRKGSLHADYARPFIEAGLPMFIDKPFTADYQEAKELIELAEKKGVKLMGGSGCKYVSDLFELRDTVAEWRKDNTFVTGCLNFAAQLDSEYNGFYFYAPHLTEMALTLFGYDLRSVRAFEKNGNVVVVARYPEFDVTLNYMSETAQTTGVLFGKKGNVAKNIDISDCYALEVERFATMLHTGETPVTSEQLIQHVAVIGAILQSLETGKEVSVF